MAICKSEHTSSASVWRRLLWWRRCRSRLRVPLARTFTQMQVCVLRDGHKGKHEAVSGLRWAYGDEFFEEPKKAGDE